MTKKNENAKRNKVIGVVLLALLAVFATWTVWENLTISVTYYEITSNQLPSAFEGYKIAQLSDVHNAEFGENNARIVEILKMEEPDLIVITGDLVDASRTDIETAAKLMRQISGIAPCYYVTGNHEAWIGDHYNILKKRLLAAGVTVLHDEATWICKNGARIQLIGLDDPAFTQRDPAVQESMLETKLKNLNLQDGFKLLLSHRPENFPAYVSAGVDLVLSGHAHGGQFRIPFIGGIAAPGQGLFPKYDAGVFYETQTAMIVSRGIGNSIIPVRVHNRPEIVMIQLHS